MPKFEVVVMWWSPESGKTTFCCGHLFPQFYSISGIVQTI